MKDGIKLCTFEKGKSIDYLWLSPKDYKIIWEQAKEKQIIEEPKNLKLIDKNIIFGSTRTAREYLRYVEGINRGEQNIREACKGKVKQSAGFKWTFTKEEPNIFMDFVKKEINSRILRGFSFRFTDVKRQKELPKDFYEWGEWLHR
jgi:hypothetical protein